MVKLPGRVSEPRRRLARSLARSLPRNVVGLCISWLVSACATPTQTAPAPQLPIATSSASGLALIWRRSDLRPVGPPIAIGTVAVGLVVTDGELLAVALDSATGRTLWQEHVTTSWIGSGDPPSVTRLGDDKVAFLRPSFAGIDDAKLVVADVRSGKELAASPDVLVTSPPVVCANGKDVCVIVSTGERHRARQFQIRLDVATGEFAIDNAKILQDTHILEKSGLIDLGDRPGNTFGLLRGGTVQWLTPGSAALPSGFSIDWSMGWQLYAEQHVFVGTSYGGAITVDDTPARDLATGFATAGISERSGKALWRDVGTTLHCNLEPAGPPVRCRMRGVKLYHDDDRSFRDLDVTVEGFEPLTGKTTWSVPLGAAQGLAAGSFAIAGTAKVVVDGSSGPILLDYSTGQVEPPEPGATLWCMATTSFELARPYWSSRNGSWFMRGGWRHKRTGGSLASICDDRGRPASALPSIAATMAAGIQLGDRAVIATAAGFLGFQAPPQVPGDASASGN